MNSHLVRNDMVHTLSTLLREHGDLVLNGTRRLTLTTACLNVLNDIFSQFLGARDNDSFTVPYGCSGNSNFMCDVFFLHDFLQKTSSLKVVQSSTTIQGGLDLSKFRCLCILELKRVPPHLLLGIDSLVLQLETLICQWSISSLKEVLCIRSTTCQPWPKLKVANLSHNSITCLDDSLTQVPQLQYLDCSNNCISSAEGIKYGHNVRVLNLSFNFLESIDSFSDKAQMSLAVLCLSNNFIETTEGLATLRSLKELDISFNCLSHGESLKGLKQLTCLNLLKLEGNPITFHHDYYTVLTSNLCSSIVTRHFMLDNHPLPRKHIKILSNCHAQVLASGTRTVESTASTASSSIGSTMESCYHPSTGTDSSLLGVSCTATSLTEHDPESTESHENEKLVVRAGKMTKSRRRVLRVAAIVDKPSVKYSTEPSGVASNVTTNREVADYRSRLESRKEQLGDEWLVGATQVHLPGAPNMSFAGSNDSSSSNAEHMASKDAHSDDDSGRAESVTTVVLKETSPTVDDRERSGIEQLDCEQTRKISEQSQGVEVLPDHPDNFDELDTSAVDGPCWVSDEQEPKSEDTVETGEDLDSKLFLARKYVDGHEATVFLGIKDFVVRESESLTGKIVQTINLTAVVSVGLDNDSTAVRLKLDTLVRSRRELYYVFDESADALEFYQVLLPFVEARALKDMTADHLQCLQCGAEFPKKEMKKVVEENIGKDTEKKTVCLVDVCPYCGSRFLVEANHPGQVSQRSLCHEGNMIKGGDTCSEDSIEALNTDLAHQLHRPGFRKSQSDITILSNPSQSSIAVLSSTSAAALCPTRDAERTVSPPPNVVLPTVTEILNEPAGYAEFGNRSSAEAVWSDCSFESARSQVTVGQKSGAGSTGSASRLKSISPWDVLQGFDAVTSESFTLIDHIVKLHLELSVFAKDEDFVCALRTSFIPSTTLEEVLALFVMSTKRAYFFKISGEESEDPESCLQLLESRPLTCLKTISSMLGNQGFRLSWHADRGNVPWQLCLLRDADCCNCFLQFFTGMLQDIVKTMPQIETAVSETLSQLTKDILPSYDTQSSASDGDGEKEVILYIMVFWSPVKGPGNSSALEPVSLVVTPYNIYVARENYIKDVKVQSRFRIQYKFLTAQKISNLTAMCLREDLVTVTLTFLDEDATGTETKWMIRTATKASLHTFLNTLRTPWEELFGIEMPLIFMS